MNQLDKAYVLIEATFNPNGMNTPEFKEYSRRSNANGEAHGGNVKYKFQITENLGDGEHPHIALLVEYPSLDKAKQTYVSDEYKNILPLRDVAFREVKIMLTNSID